MPGSCTRRPAKTGKKGRNFHKYYIDIIIYIVIVPCTHHCLLPLALMTWSSKIILRFTDWLISKLVLLSRNLLSHKSQLARQVARRIASDVLDSLTREDLGSLSFYFQCKVNCPKILPCCSVWQEMQFCHADSSAAGSSEERSNTWWTHCSYSSSTAVFPWQDTPPIQEEPVGQADEVRFCPAEH